MKLETGTVLTGKVTGITKFGAFVSVAPGKSGLVHISEIANSYVNDISEFLTVGQEVNVKIINIDANGRLNLSIKAALPESDAPKQESRKPAFREQRRPNTQSSAPAAHSAPKTQTQPSHPVSAPSVDGYVPQSSGDASFEDKLKRFMQDSDSKIAGVRQYAERKTSRRRSR